MNQTAHLFTSEKLLEILSLSPNATAIYTGEEITIQAANDVMLGYWGKGRNVIGLPLVKAVPELEGQAFIDLLRNVWCTGESFEAKDTAAELKVGGRIRTFYFDFLYRAIRDDNGRVECILHTATDVSDRVAARQLLNEAKEQKAALDREQLLNERLAAANQELERSKGSVNALNLELESRVDNRTKALAASESRLRSLITHAPVAIGLLRGRQLIVEMANARLLQVWGKPDVVTGKPLAIVLPELQGQPFLEILDNVFTKGEPYYNPEVPCLLEHNGALKQYYFDLLYQPLKDPEGITESIFVVATDLTEQVKARREIQEAAAIQGFTIEAADVGTWRLYLDNNEFIPSPRLKTLFGFQAEEEVTYEQAVGRIPQEHRHRIENEIRKALTKGTKYNVEHPIGGLENGKPRWVRAIGKLNEEANSNRPYFSGIVIDITEQKQDEQRKSDFIGMVSHELKTPLTSLGGYIHMLELNAKKTGYDAQSTIAEKASKQVKKMTRMVHSFLTISRLTAGKIYLEIEQFDIENLVEEVVEENRIAYPGHRINFRQCKSISITADRDKIGQVITNFISNAVKYAPGNKTIDVACLEIGGEVKISVSDYGVGIKPEDKAKLFERYYRVENSLTRHVTGFGIGLYLCAEIIERHQGKIGVESVSGNGSTFYFILKYGLETQ